LITDREIRLAAPGDAPAIAVMSRDLIEQGLGWRWTPRRILQSIRDPTTNVAVSCERGQLAGFGIMKYDDQDAHLNLLAVLPRYRRTGVGGALMSWLENCALTAGIGTIYLEARATNTQARSFYKHRGYREMALVSRYYWGREDGVQIAKDLWQ
jgi:[ribosomal protein S18]-alanine N-acetyltransferase